MTAINVVKTSLGVNASGFETFEVKNADTGEIIGTDIVAPDDSEQSMRYEDSRIHDCFK